MLPDRILRKAVDAVRSARQRAAMNEHLERVLVDACLGGLLSGHEAVLCGRNVPELPRVPAASSSWQKCNGTVTLLPRCSRRPATVIIAGEHPVEQLGGERVHHLVAADVVLDGDPWVAVTEEFGGEVDPACSLIAVATVRRNRCGVTPVMPARSITCRSWRRTLFAVNGVPSRLLNSNASGDGLLSRRESAPDGLGGEGRDRDTVARVAVFGWSCRSVGSPLRLTIVPQIRIDGGAGDVDVPAAEGEDLADPRRSAEHDLHDRPQLPVRLRPGRRSVPPPNTRSRRGSR